MMGSAVEVAAAVEETCYCHRLMSGEETAMATGATAAKPH